MRLLAPIFALLFFFDSNYAQAMSGRPKHPDPEVFRSENGKLYVCLLPKVKDPIVKIKPFTTDGCSSISPDGTWRDPKKWRHCCVDHDKEYWVGGTKQERWIADKELQKCIAKTGHPKYAKVAFLGVQLGGHPYSKKSYRWGYGWPRGRGYAQFTRGQLKHGFLWSQAEIHVNPKPFKGCFRVYD